MALLESLLQVGVGIDLHAGGLAELLEIGLVGLGILDGHGLVGAPGRDDLYSEGVLGYHLVPAQVIGRIVGCADRLDTELLDQSLAAELLRGELGVAFVENLTGGIRP